MLKSDWLIFIFVYSVLRQWVILQFLTFQLPSVWINLLVSNFGSAKTVFKMSSRHCWTTFFPHCCISELLYCPNTSKLSLTYFKNSSMSQKQAEYLHNENTSLLIFKSEKTIDRGNKKLLPQFFNECSVIEINGFVI